MASERHEEEQAEKAFTVSDKRLFTKEGARRDPDTPRETPAASPPPPPPPPRREAPRAAEPQRQRPEPERQRPEPGAGTRRDLPPADFTMLVNMLVTNAMVFLGQMPAPGSQQYMRNLPQAQHMIDLLMVLRERTRGNLTPDEDQMMQDLLPQLQMAYVSASRQVG
jgi:type IV secretory pathway VirB10-like protein